MGTKSKKAATKTVAELYALRDNCASCGKIVPINARVRKNCPQCVREHKNLYRKVHHYSFYSRLKKYGISPEEYMEMYEEQQGKCAICGNPETATDSHGNVKMLSVDHCHNTEKVRGLLCSVHNTGLGYFQDNVETLKRAIAYLEQHQTAQEQTGAEPIAA